MFTELFEFLESSESEEHDFSSSSSSSSEDESENEEYVAITTFIETINEMGEKTFKSHFRLNRPTVLHIIELYADLDSCPSDGNGSLLLHLVYEQHVYIQRSWQPFRVKKIIDLEMCISCVKLAHFYRT